MVNKKKAIVILAVALGIICGIIFYKPAHIYEPIIISGYDSSLVTQGDYKFWVSQGDSIFYIFSRSRWEKYKVTLDYIYFFREIPMSRSNK
jgi:hypothetical protein